MKTSKNASPVPNKPSHNNPGGNPGSVEKGNNASQPKKPGNDPDQTPDKEIKKQPQGEPGKSEPSKTPNSTPGKR